MSTRQDSSSKSTKYSECAVPADGNCLFWAVALAYLTSVENDFILFGERFAKLFGQDKREDLELLHHVKDIIFNYNPIEDSSNLSDEKLNTLVTRDFRKKVVDHIRVNRHKFEDFIKTEESVFENYLDWMNKPGTWGGNPEIEAMCQILECKIQVHSETTYDFGVGNELIVLFHNRNHYNFGIVRREINTTSLTETERNSAPRGMIALNTRKEFDMNAQRKLIDTSLASDVSKTLSLKRQNNEPAETAMPKKVIKCEQKGGFTNAEHGKTNVAAIDNYGLTVLHCAAQKDKWDVVQWLVEHGKANDEATNKYGKTVLHYAAQWNKLDVVQWLVEYGADVNAIDIDGKTPLNLAEKQKHKNIIEYLKKG